LASMPPGATDEANETAQREQAWTKAGGARGLLAFVDGVPGQPALCVRNMLAHCNGDELVLLLDERLLPEPGLLAAHVQAHSGHATFAMVPGSVEPVFVGSPRLWDAARADAVRTRTAPPLTHCSLKAEFLHRVGGLTCIAAPGVY